MCRHNSIPGDDNGIADLDVIGDAQVDRLALLRGGRGDTLFQAYSNLGSFRQNDCAKATDDAAQRTAANNSCASS